MKHRPRPPEQDDLLRPRLVDLIDMRHELAKLAGLIDGEFLGAEGAGARASAPLRGPRPRRVDLMDMRHAVVKLAGLIAWEFCETEWSGFFPSSTGRPAT